MPEREPNGIGAELYLGVDRVGEYVVDMVHKQAPQPLAAYVFGSPEKVVLTEVISLDNDFRQVISIDNLRAFSEERGEGTRPATAVIGALSRHYNFLARHRLGSNLAEFQHYARRLESPASPKARLVLLADNLSGLIERLDHDERDEQGNRVKPKLWVAGLGAGSLDFLKDYHSHLEIGGLRD